MFVFLLFCLWLHSSPLILNLPHADTDRHAPPRGEVPLWATSSALHTWVSLFATSTFIFLSLHWWNHHQSRNNLLSHLWYKAHRFRACCCQVLSSTSVCLLPERLFSSSCRCAAHGKQTFKYWETNASDSVSFIPQTKLVLNTKLMTWWHLTLVVFYSFGQHL